jgi:hypothetical protein
MAVRNTMLATAQVLTVQQDIRSLLRLLEDPEAMALALQQPASPAQAIAQLLWDTKAVMNQYCGAAPWFCFEPELRETALIHYTNAAGIGILVVPPSAKGYNGNGPQIRPAFISDGFSTVLDQSRDNVVVYLVDNFTLSEQLEMLQVILQWYKANFTGSKGNGASRISTCVKEFCETLENIMTSSAAWA